MNNQSPHCWNCAYSGTSHDGTLYCTKLQCNCISNLDCTKYRAFECLECKHSMITEPDDVFPAELYCTEHGYPCEQIKVCTALEKRTN